ncbi:MAG: DNA polymerase IV, partial [Leptotrichiaceae bacterium]
YIFENTGLTCSVGIGFNRLSAKIASDINKPNGFFIFSDQQHFLDYISEKNISVIPSIGKRTIELLNLFNITKVGQLFKLEKDELISKFGINRGEHLYNLVRGVGSSAISKDRKRQSIGHETTFNITINDTNQLKEELKTLSMRLSKKLKSQNLFIKTISLKIRYSNFSTHTKSKTLSFATNSFDLIYAEVLYIFNSLNDKQNVRLIGVHLSSFAKKSFVQLKL